MMEHCAARLWRNASALFYCVIRPLMRALMNNMLSISIGEGIEERGQFHNQSKNMNALVIDQSTKGFNLRCRRAVS